MDTLFWLIDSQTFGGVIVLVLFAFALLAYFFTLRWIVAGAREEK
jgi:hypothetical protein